MFIMKNVKNGLLILVLLILTLTLTACTSSFNSIKKSFEDAGYTYDEDTATDYENVFDGKDGEKISVTVHAFSGDLLSYAIVFEFKSTSEMDKAIENSSTLKGALEDLQKSDLVRGNCFLLPITLNPDEMINIFQGK